MKINEVVIDAYKTMGEKLFLVDVSPAYEYKNNQRTENVAGYKYEVAMFQNGLDKINVKIAGKKLLDPPTTGFAEVTFEGLDVYIYFGHDRQPQIAARATGISLVNKKA